jgi:hypothetical protein
MSNNNKTSTKLFFAALTLAGFSVFQGNINQDFVNGTGGQRKDAQALSKVVNTGELSEAEYNQKFTAAVDKKQRENPNVNSDDIKALVSAEFKVKGVKRKGADEPKPKSLADQKTALEAILKTLEGNEVLRSLREQKEVELALVDAQFSLEKLSIDLDPSQRKALEDIVKVNQEKLKQMKLQDEQTENTKSDPIDVAQEAMKVLVEEEYKFNEEYGKGVSEPINEKLRDNGMHYAIPLAFIIANSREDSLERRRYFAELLTVASKYSEKMSRRENQEGATIKDKKAAKIAKAIFEVVNQISARIK